MIESLLLTKPYFHQARSYKKDNHNAGPGRGTKRILQEEVFNGLQQAHAKRMGSRQIRAKCAASMKLKKQMRTRRALREKGSARHGEQLTQAKEELLAQYRLAWARLDAVGSHFENGVLPLPSYLYRAVLSPSH